MLKHPYFLLLAMKCIQCSTDNTLSDRTANQGRCKQCQHPFAFEPTQMTDYKLTDPLFAKVVEDLSANSTLFFTPKQFLYLLDKRLKLRKSIAERPGPGYALIVCIGLAITTVFPTGVLSNIASTLPGRMVFTFGWEAASLLLQLILLIVPSFVLFLWIRGFYQRSQSSKLAHLTRSAAAYALKVTGFFTLVFGTVIALIFGAFPIFATAVVLGITALFLGAKQARKLHQVPQEFLFDQTTLHQWLARWKSFNGDLSKLLPPPQDRSAIASVNPDVMAYSFDRLVVCDSAAIAQLLIANNFHFENNCAILSITGYPKAIFKTTLEMVRRNPDLKVYALHDCSPQGIQLVHQLQTSPEWFQDNSSVIVDVGLSPRQVLTTPNLVIVASSESARSAQRLPSAIRSQLSPEELRWLDAGNFVELESFTPQRIIQVLNHGIAGTRQLAGDSDSGGDFIYIGDSSGGSVYGAESFG